MAEIKCSRHLSAMLAWVMALSMQAEVWTLDDCVAYALENNINVRRQQLRVREGDLSLTEAKDRVLPTVGASAGQSFSLGRGLSSNNTYENKNSSSTQWGVNLSLPLFQGLAAYERIQVARLSLQQYVWEHEATKDDVALNIISQYLQVLYCKEVGKSARSQAELSEFEVERQKEMIAAGRVAEATLYDLEAVAAQDRLQIVTADNDTRTALVNLANLLQLKSVEDFDIAGLDDSDATAPIPDAQSVYAIAVGGNNSVMGARQAVKVAERNISLARTGYIPTLAFNAGIGSTYYNMSGMPNQSFSSQMKNNFSTMFSFSLNIPIFDGFNTRNSIRRANLQKLDAQLALSQREADLYKEIQLAYYQAVGARERFITSGETLEKTRLSFDATRERFNLGRATQADFEQAKNNLFKTEVGRIQSHYEYLLRVRILEFYKSCGWKQ